MKTFYEVWVDWEGDRFLVGEFHYLEDALSCYEKRRSIRKACTPKVEWGGKIIRVDITETEIKVEENNNDD